MSFDLGWTNLQGEPMKTNTIDRKKVIGVLVAGLLLIAALGGAIALTHSHVSAQSSTGGGDEDEADDRDDGQEGPDVSITGSALEKASAAALDYTGGGLVTETEVGDEEGYYEIEVTRPDGRQVDVHLDADFNVLGQETD
jgi:uncharacterized membrane protein YkoI